MATASDKAQAQAFNGTPSTVAGSVTYNRTVPTTETITINSNSAVINWGQLPTAGQDGTINFLPNGNTATFQGASGFTVLNRISATSPVAFNGRVISQLQGTGARGGTVWFYSPAGIVVGSTAVFDVGNLLLTANDPVFDPQTGALGNQFTAGVGSTASVVVQPGAQINATAENSYVALIAPRVEQHGTVSVNGTASYVAGEQLTMTIDQGLFDISIDVGTTDPNGIVHTGTTTGPASSAAADRHRINMVAVPKNQALTMLLSGDIGFAPATNVTVQNGQIALSAGFNIDNGNINHNSGNGVPANISIGSADFTSVVFGVASSTIGAIANEGSIIFGDNADLRAYEGVILAAINGGDVTVNGDLVLIASKDGTAGDIAVSVDASSSILVTGATIMSADGEAVNGGAGTGGTVTVTADGGTITFEESAYLSADGYNYDNSNEANGFVQGGEVTVTATGGGIINFDELTATANGYGQIISGATLGTASSARGGTVNFTADTLGSITVGSEANFAATGAGGTGLNGAAAGDGTGGIINIAAGFEGVIEFQDLVVADANGTGGGFSGAGTVGGLGQGGDVLMSVSDGTITVDGTATFTAEGLGGGLFGPAAGGTQTGGDGLGGYARIESNGPGSIAITGGTTLRADGRGGNGQSGGDGFGGNAGVTAYDGEIGLGGTVLARAVGTGGSATVGFGGTGGLGDGGTAYVEALGYPGNIEVQPYAGTITGGDTVLDASGIGGAGGAGTATIAAGAGGIGRGGTFQGEIGTGGAFAAALADGAVLVLDGTILHASGTGGAGGAAAPGQTGGAGGAGYGGTVQAGLYNTYESTDLTGSASFGDLALFTQGTGGAGGLGAGLQGLGGNGYAGGSWGGGGLYVNAKGEFAAEDLRLFAEGTGGTGGGQGFGGYIQAAAFDGSLFTVDTLSMTANGSTEGGLALIAAAQQTTTDEFSLFVAGAVTASANGPAQAGQVIVEVAAGHVVDLGVAQLSSMGGALEGAGIVLAVDRTADEMGTVASLVADSLSLDSTSTIEIAASNGALIDVSGGLTATTGGLVILAGEGGTGTIAADQLTIDSGTFAYNVGLSALGIAITVDGSLLLGDLSAGQTLAINAGGAIDAGDLSAGQTLSLTAAGDIDTGNLTAGQSISLAAGGDASVLNASAGGTIDILAEGTAYLYGLVSAPEITVTSSDIEIFGQLGEWGVTDLLTLNAVSGGAPVLIGGEELQSSAVTTAALADQYWLSADEEVQAATIIFNALGADGGPAPDVILGDLEIAGSATDGGGAGHVELNTGGSVVVEGLVLFADAAADDVLAITAGGAIIVNTSEGGRIAMIDSDVTPSGILELTASDIWVGDQALLDALAADREFSGRDVALATNPGADNQDGTAIAGGMTLTLEGSLFVQNSGTPTAFAGITVGDGGLEIVSSGQSPATVVAYGQKRNGDGTTVGGDAFFDEILFDGAAGFAAASAFNGCSVGAGCFVPPPPPPGPPILPTIVSGPEAILGPVDLMGTPAESSDPEGDGEDAEEGAGVDEDGEEGSDNSDVNTSGDLIDTDELSDEDLIQEPVTSGGDVTQWLVETPAGEEQ